MKADKILVTGASGFLGCRLVEHLVFNEKVSVRAMAHRPGSASRLARMAVETVWGDITKLDDALRAVEGCDVVVHCAYGAGGYPSDNRKATVQGSSILAQAAVRAGVRRFVHISSVAVHSYMPRGVVTEDSPFGRPSDNYCKDKIDAEKAVIRIRDRSQLPLVILRMGNIYGPFSGPWTGRPLNLIKNGQVSLVDEGKHNCNMVFVDNAVEAILKTIREDKSVGETFFITDNPVSWRDFYGEYAKWLNIAEIKSIPLEDLMILLHPSVTKKIRAFGRDLGSHILIPTARYAAFRFATSDYLGRLASSIWGLVPHGMRMRILGDPYGKSIPPAIQLATSGVPGLPPLGLLEVYAGKTTFSNEKARRILGYGPEITTNRALEITRSWASWARMI